MNIIKLINDFIDNKYDLLTFKDQLSLINDFSELSKKQDFKDIDKAIHAYLLILFNKYELLNLTLESDNECYLYLQDITENIETSNFNIIYEDTIKLIVNVDNLYFLINNSNTITTFDVPYNIQNKTVFCINCNDDMKLKTTIKLPDYSFYAFLDE